MTNDITYHGHTITRYVVAIDEEGRVIGEFSALTEARAFVREHVGNDADYLYAAARVLDDSGNIGWPCYGATLSEATNQVKNQL